MSDELASETRLMNEAKRLVSVGYWHMPDATPSERAVAADAQGALQAMSVLHENRDVLSDHHREAGKLVSAELAGVLCGHMKHAVAEHHLNVRSVRDDIALSYAPAPVSPAFTGEVRPHQLEMAKRIAEVVNEATVPGGVWPSHGPEAWCSRSIARQLSQSVAYLGARGEGSSPAASACATAAVGLADRLSKHVGDAVGMGLVPERLREPIHLPIYAETLRSITPAASATRGPESGIGHVAPVLVSQNVRD